MSPSLPAEWREVESPDYIVEKYRAKNPTLFVRDDHEFGVHVLPISTSSPHEPEEYRAGVIVGAPDDFEEEIPIGTFDDEERAFTRALEYANHYEDVYDERTNVETAVRSAADDFA